MEWVIYLFASGLVFFPGAWFLILAPWVVLWNPSFLWRRISSFLVLTGGILVAASATPCSIFFYCVLAIATLSWQLSEFWGARATIRLGTGNACEFPIVKRRNWRRESVILFKVAHSILWAVAICLELPFHLAPVIPPTDFQKIILVGDSISAAIEDRGTTWPKLLKRAHGIEVQDLSRIGATCRTALSQYAKGQPGPAMVLLEIGGNDLLGIGDSARFSEDLETLLSAVSKSRRPVVMFELPLPPSYNAFGRIQRQMAAKYGVILIPKRFLMHVLATRGSTTDSIHLTQQGHQMMAEIVWDLLHVAFAK